MSIPSLIVSLAFPPSSSTASPTLVALSPTNSLAASHFSEALFLTHSALLIMPFFTYSALLLIPFFTYSILLLIPFFTYSKLLDIPFFISLKTPPISEPSSSDFLDSSSRDALVIPTTGPIFSMHTSANSLGSSNIIGHTGTPAQNALITPESIFISKLGLQP